MSNQQNGNNVSATYNQPWSEGVLKNEKFSQLKGSRTLSIIAAVFSTTWISMLIIAIILFVVSANGDIGLNIAGGVFIAIGLLIMFSGFIISIIASAKIFSIANSPIIISNNPNFDYQPNLTGPKVLSVIGAFLFAWGIGTILFWLTVHLLSLEIKKYK